MGNHHLANSTVLSVAGKSIDGVLKSMGKSVMRSKTGS